MQSVKAHLPEDTVTRAKTSTVAKFAILCALDEPEPSIVAMVESPGYGASRAPLRQPFHREPDFGVTSVSYDFAELLARGAEPS